MSTGSLTPATRALENDILSQLKQHTQPFHHALEQTDMSRLLMSPALDRATYVHILYGFYGAFSTLEAVLAHLTALAGSSELSGLIDPRSVLAVEDLRYLTGTFDATLLFSKPFIPQGHPLSVALGILYVLEGSKLGGKIISRQLSHTLNLTPTAGGRFFAGTGGLGLESWKLFRARCSAYAAHHPEHVATILESANSTFHYLLGYFQQHYSIED